MTSSASLCKAWEAETQPASDAGVRTVMIRSGIVLAAHGGVLKRLLLPFKLGLGGKQGSGKQWMSWIALVDEVAAIMHALGSDTLHGPVNLTAPQPVTNAEFARTLGTVLHRPTVLPTPAFPLKLVYGDELVETLLMGGQRVLPARLQSNGYKFRHSTLEDALRAVLDRH